MVLFSLFKKKTPYEKELALLKKAETRFFEERREKQDGFLNRILADKVPAKLQGTLDAAFAKAFALVFEKGTGVIEKTYMKNKAHEKYLFNEVRHFERPTHRTLKAFSRKAAGTGNKNLLITSATGIGMGLAGFGLPDIPVFTAMVMKAIYEIATSYGYGYESVGERAFILKIIQGSLSYGDDIIRIDNAINKMIARGELPHDYDHDAQIKETAGALSKELLYMKFIQGAPLIGVIGGIYDAVYMRRITEYATLKYRRRFLHDKYQHL